MKKIVIFLFIFLSVSMESKSDPVDSLSVNSNYKSQAKYYKRINELQAEFIIGQLKNDSLKNLELDRYRNNIDMYKDSLSWELLDMFNSVESKRQKEIHHLKIKNLILVISIGAGLVVYSLIQ